MVFRRKNINHFSSEKIHRTEVVAFTTDRRYGSIPFSHLAPKFRHVDRSHELETWIIEIFVLLCRYSSCFHVGLSYTKIYEKLGSGLLSGVAEALKIGNMASTATTRNEIFLFISNLF